MSKQTLANKLGTVADYQAGTFTDKTFKLQLIPQANSNSFTDKATGQLKQVVPASYRHPMIFQTATSKKAKEEGQNGLVIGRYVPGEASIWKNKQTDDDKVPKITQFMEFVNGMKTIDGSDTALISFIMEDPANESSPNYVKGSKAIYRIVDTKKVISEDFKKDRMITDIKNWCYTGRFDEVAAYARVLGVSLSADPDEVRYAMQRVAMSNPAKFAEGMHNPLTLRKHHVLEAIDAGILDLDQDLNALTWSNGGLIHTSPVSVSPVDSFVDQSTTEKGEALYAEIIARLGKSSAPSNPSLEGVTVESTGFTEDDAKDLMNEALSKKVLTFKGKAILVLNADTENEVKKIGYKGVIEAIRTDQDYLEALVTAIDAAKTASPNV